MRDVIQKDNNLEDWCKKNKREDILMMWSYEKNTVSPSEISFGSHKPIFWKCDKNHFFERSAHMMLRSKVCPVCNGNKVFKHRESLFVEYPNLIAEIDLDKNTYEEVCNYSACSNKTIFWKCERGHKYGQSATAKSQGRGCPVCNNRLVVEGVNDLETWCIENNRTEILDEWDYKLNEITPKEITYGSNRKVNFICRFCGYSWRTVVASRTSQGTGCKRCNGTRFSSSFSEQAIYYYIKKIYPDAINGDRKELGRLELDIYVPSIKVAIEYDGRNWHKDHMKDTKKDSLCREKGITLFRVREEQSNKYESDYAKVFHHKIGDWDALSEIIRCIIFNISKETIDVDVKRDNIIIKEQYYNSIKEKSLAIQYSELSNEWHPEKNGKITPYMVMPETHDSFFWLCKNGHTFEASVKNRVRMHSGCPICANQKIMGGYNDIETTHPEVAIDYDNERNERKSNEVSEGCSDFVWFKCHKCGYRYYYQLNTYIKAKMSCPACTGRGKTKFKKVLKYETGELFDTLPEAARSLGFIDEKDVKRVYKSIHVACKGKMATSHGYHWFYVLVDENGTILDDISSFEIKNYNTNILGQSFKMKNGQSAVVIADRGSGDVDVQFEDGTIVTNKTRQNVKKGNVKNPNYIRETVLKDSIQGQRFTTNEGEGLTVLSDKGYQNVDVCFDDGTILKNISRVVVKNGSIRNPNKKAIRKTSITLQVSSRNENNKKQKKIEPAFSIEGQSYTMKNGQSAVVIADRGCGDVDVQFEDGTIVTNRTRQSVRKGNVKNPNVTPKKIIKNSIIGATRVMKNGMSATVIKDNGWNDIDVQFEDGTIVSNMLRSAFRNGSISNPNDIFLHMNEQRVMKCGLKCKVIEIINKNDISVLFEDGSQVDHVPLSKFLNGSILTYALSHNFKYRKVGEKKLMNCGKYATLIEDRGAHDIDVQFEDGLIVRHRDRSNFDKGNIAYPVSLVGMEKVMNCGMKAKVIEDKGWNNITVQFENGTIVTGKRREHFKTGSISV